MPRSTEILPTKLDIFLLICQISTIISITAVLTIQITLLYANKSIDTMDNCEQAGIIANSPVAMVIVVVPMVHLQISSIKTFCTNGINATFSEKEYLALTPPKMIVVCPERILAWATKFASHQQP